MCYEAVSEPEGCMCSNLSVVLNNSIRAANELSVCMTMNQHEDETLRETRGDINTDVNTAEDLLTL